MTGQQEAPEPFGVALEPHREAVAVVARGELDLDSATELQERFRDVLEAGFSRIVLDLRSVSFIDSTGLRTVLAMDSASRDAGVRFALIQGPGPVRRLFELTKTEEALRFIDARDVDAGWT